MFKALRKMIFPIIIIVLFFFAAMIVLEWGLGMSSRSSYQTTSVAAIINGEEIPWPDYNRIYNNLRQQEMEKNPEAELSDDAVQKIRTDSWNQLVYDRLITQEVAKHNIMVTDEELYQYLRMTPPADLQSQQIFLTDGKFDYQKYLTALVDPNMSATWARLEPGYRIEIQKLKVQEMIIQTAHVTESEAMEYFRAGEERITVGMINVDYGHFSRPPPTSTEEEMKAFFEERQDDYQLGKRAVLNLILLEKKPSPNDWEEALARSRELYDSVQAGIDFAYLAENYSEEPAARESKGDLGFFAREAMVDEFSVKAFSMKPGEISEPTRTQFGWHIIKCHEFKDEMEIPRGKTEKESVRKVHCSHILIKAEASLDTRDNLFERLEEFRIQAGSNGFFTAAEDLSLPVKTTTPFTETANIQFVGRNPEATAFAFEAEIGEMSMVMENRSSVMVMELAQIIPAGPASFEHAQRKVSQDIVIFKVANLCRDTAQAIWDAIQTGTDPKAAAAQYSCDYETPEPFKRGSFVKGLARDPKAIGAAFSLTQPDQMVGPVEYDQGNVIFQLIERTQVDLSTFETVRDSIKYNILINKQQELFGRWFEQKIEQSEIINNTLRSGIQRDF